MHIVGVTDAELDAALAAVNQRFGGNIRWNRHDAVNRACTTWEVTLRCYSSRASGHGISYSPATGSWRNLATACWHVHGYFFDALPPHARINARGQPFSPGDPWRDFDVGSVVYPRYASEACSCDS